MGKNPKLHVYVYGMSESTGQMFGKDPRSDCSTLLPMLRGIAGSAQPTVSLVSNFRSLSPLKGECRLAAIVPGTAFVSC